jgi:hypothetical protein
MRRSSLFLTAAVGLLASFALAVPTHAGTITIAGTYDISPANVLELEFAFSSAVSTPTGTSSSPLGSFSASGDNVLFDLPAPGAPSGSLSFTVMTTGFYEGTSVASFTGIPAGFHLNFVPTTGSVPEPTSIVLLGIGVVGFFTYRRLFKRPATA